MQFKDAAEEILKESGKPLHYNEITERALKKGILDTAGQTPEATMGALLYTDTLNEDSRFQREGKGLFALKESLSSGLEYQIRVEEAKLRKELRAQILKMEAVKFEELIEALLELMGFEETRLTPKTNDKGIDVRGVLKSNQLTPIRVAIQAKRWSGNVGSKEVQALRGSLDTAKGEHGILITSKDFTANAKTEAEESNRLPITLINGEAFTNLLFEYKLGIKEEQHIVHSIDTAFWLDAYQLSFEEEAENTSKKEKPQSKLKFPIELQAFHNDKTFTAQLLDDDWTILYNGKKYDTPSGAATVVATDWKRVNGWKFWRYLDSKTGEWEYIANLREE